MSATIQKIVKRYLKTHSWPEKGVALGPGVCDKLCTKHHAYAKTISYGIWIYYLPCKAEDGEQLSLL